MSVTAGQSPGATAAAIGNATVGSAVATGATIVDTGAVAERAPARYQMLVTDLQSDMYCTGP